MKRTTETIRDLRTLQVPTVGELQREFNGKHVIFKKEFDRNKVNISIWVPDGLDVQLGYVVDGQHSRAFALARRDVENYEVVALHGGTPAEAADYFLGINADRRSVDSISLLKVSATRGDVDAVEIAAVLRRQDLTLTGAPGVGNVAAAKALAYVHKLGGWELVDRTLGVLGSAFGRRSEGFHNVLVRGVGLALTQYPKADDAAIVRGFKRWDPIELRVEASSMHKKRWASSAAEAVSMLTVRSHDKHKRGNGKLADA